MVSLIFPPPFIEAKKQNKKTRSVAFGLKENLKFFIVFEENLQMQKLMYVQQSVTKRSKIQLMWMNCQRVSLNLIQHNRLELKVHSVQSTSFIFYFICCLKGSLFPAMAKI